LGTPKNTTRRETHKDSLKKLEGVGGEGQHSFCERGQKKKPKKIRYETE